MNQISPDKFTPEGVESAAQRNKPRDSLFLVAGLRVEGVRGTTQVRVRNLSSGGMMAEFPQSLDIGRAVEVELRGIGKILGEVAWTAAGRIGISFEHPIDPLMARKPVVVARKGPTKDKPIKPIL